MNGWLAMHRLNLLVSCYLLSSGISGSNGVVATAILERAQGVVDWVVAENGYFNDKQSIRRVDPTPMNGVSATDIGIFADREIEAGELLARIPWNTIIMSSPNDEAKEPDSSTPLLPCLAIERLIREMKLAEESSFGPFVEFLLEMETPFIPSSWSDAGKYLLNQALTGTNRFHTLPPKSPTSSLETEWQQGCAGERGELEDRAALMALSRAKSGMFVPIYDMYNHDMSLNRKVTAKVEFGVHYQLFATATIKAGEELYSGYADCPECITNELYGTSEIFRDFGFVENYPQLWTFYFDNFKKDMNIFELRREAAGASNQYSIIWELGKNDIEAHEYLRDMLGGLGRFRSGELAAGLESWSIARNTTARVPQREWDAVVSYVDAMILALTNAIFDVKDLTINEDGTINFNADEQISANASRFGCLNEVNDSCFRRELYHPLTTEIDEPLKRDMSCNTDASMDFSNYYFLDRIETEYQKVAFRRQHDAENRGVGDICMDLDGIFQICDSYRPHYHEYAINYAARYLEDVKRVAFIGGGDSMILHEFLKYPNLELVVGLELDQVVVRNAFKWFHTDPHFHDDRVEWWFGDATKSLLLLPKDYANSFDMVMVDVSETGASLTVTDQLDIFNAMALLVKPDGIMVKNEPYFHQMSQVFDYSVDVHFYHCPAICDQSMILGSNHIDFYHHDNLTDHGVENLLLPEIEDYPHPYLLWRDFKINDPIEDGSCARLEQGLMAQNENAGGGSANRKGKSEGMLMIVEIEDCKVDMEQLQPIVVATLESLGFKAVSPPLKSTESFDKTIVMAEGYVVVRQFPDSKYVALDICLWGRFDLMDATRAAIVEALGSGNDVKKGSVSSYRIVVSGMYGNDSWEKDDELIGPDISQSTRKCDTEETRKAEEVIEASIIPKIDDLHAGTFLKTALDTIVNTMLSSGSHIVVFCGKEGAQCPVASVLEDNVNVGQVLKLHSCPEIAEIQFGEEADAEILHTCRMKLEEQMRSFVYETVDGPIDGVILDSDAPYTMAQIFSSLWTFRRNSIQERVVNWYASVMSDSTKDEWRRNALKNIRLKLQVDPLTRSELVVKPKGFKRDDPAYVFNMMSVDMSLDLSDVFPRIRSIEDSLLEKYGEEFDIYPTVIEAAQLTMYTDDDTYDPIPFKPSDYDTSASKEQYKNQIAHGRQTIFQLGRDKMHRDSSPNIGVVLEEVLTVLGYDVFPKATHVHLGEGEVDVISFQGGNLATVWDGRNHMTLNLFQRNQDRQLADAFLETVLKSIGGGWEKELRDDMPRGVNRVINFSAASK